MLKQVIIIGTGGFIGTVARYLTTELAHKSINTNFPLATLAINLAGCFLIGVFFGLFEKGNLMSAELRLFLTVGFCGGFTTFSAFANDSINLYSDSEFLYLSLYLGVSVFAGLLMTYFGKSIVNYFLS
ncbi:MAG: fluoride efflux transporter CrcB [Chloroflexota bacterium]